MMDKDLWKNQWEDLKDVVTMFFDLMIVLLSTLPSVVFIIGWIVAQHYGNYLINKLDLPDLDTVTLVIFRIIFALSTLFFLVVFIYYNHRLIFLKARKRFERQRDRINKNHNDQGKGGRDEN